jgi:hypothetical protein
MKEAGRSDPTEAVTAGIDRRVPNLRFTPSAARSITHTNHNDHNVADNTALSGRPGHKRCIENPQGKAAGPPQPERRQSGARESPFVKRRQQRSQREAVGRAKRQYENRDGCHALPEADEPEDGPMAMSSARCTYPTFRLKDTITGQRR